MKTGGSVILLPVTDSGLLTTSEKRKSINPVRITENSKC